MSVLSKLKIYYSQHPIVIAGLAIITVLGIIVVLWSFINIMIEAYGAYGTYSTGTQILVMTVVNIIITFALILLVVAYLSAKMDELIKKKKE